MSKFVPVYLYAQKKNIPKQTVYRWIREGKIKEEDIKREEITVTRIRVKADSNPT